MFDVFCWCITLPVVIAALAVTTAITLPVFVIAGWMVKLSWKYGVRPLFR